MLDKYRKESRRENKRAISQNGKNNESESIYILQFFLVVFSAQWKDTCLGTCTAAL